MNLKEFSKDYCAAYNWINSGSHKVYCNPHCPHFMGLSKGKPLKILCEYTEVKKYDALLRNNE